MRFEINWIDRETVEVFAGEGVVDVVIKSSIMNSDQAKSLAKNLIVVAHELLEVESVNNQ